MHLPPSSRRWIALLIPALVLSTLSALGAAHAQTVTPVPQATPTADPSIIPTPTPRPAGTTPRVGLQVGHWKSNELPDELARLRGSTGAFAGGYAEWELNLAIAKRVEALLTAQGILVDLLPATVPPGYDADAFVAIHADGAAGSTKRGYKLATPWRSSRASQHLLEALAAEYGDATGLPRDGGITVDMRGYYAFNYRRHTHAVARTTPAVILEMGFITSAADRAVLYGKAHVVAAGIAAGIMRYLSERDPLDGAALLPPEFGSFRPISADGLDVRAAPSDRARVLLRAPADARLFPFQERDGWLEVMVRGERRVIGWVRRDELTSSGEPTPTPPPATDP